MRAGERKLPQTASSVAKQLSSDTAACCCRRVWPHPGSQEGRKEGEMTFVDRNVTRGNMTDTRAEDRRRRKHAHPAQRWQLASIAARLERGRPRGQELPANVRGLGEGSHGPWEQQPSGVQKETLDGVQGLQGGNHGTPRKRRSERTEQQRTDGREDPAPEHPLPPVFPTRRAAPGRSQQRLPCGKVPHGGAA